MEQQLRPQAKKQINKKMIISIVAIIIVIVIIALVVISLGYNQLMTSNQILDQTTCQARMTSWCNQCLSANAGRKDFWNVAGTQIGSDLVACSNSYFGSSMTSGQYCTGNSLVYCSKFISLQVE